MRFCIFFSLHESESAPLFCRHSPHPLPSHPPPHPPPHPPIPSHPLSSHPPPPPPTIPSSISLFISKTHHLRPPQMCWGEAWAAKAGRSTFFCWKRRPLTRAEDQIWGRKMSSVLGLKFRFGSRVMHCGDISSYMLVTTMRTQDGPWHGV